MRARRPGSRACGPAALLGLAVACALIASFSVGASDAAEPAELYIGSGPGYSIAFEVEGAEVSVLALDAKVYCSFTEPRERLGARLNGFFPLPALMREVESGLTVTAAEGGGGEFGGESTRVDASFEGGKLVGEFTHRGGEESFHCQSGGYYLDAPDAVAFEAVRYVPVTDSEAISPAGPEPAIYFSGPGSPLQAFFRVEDGRAYVRGSLATPCRFEGKGATLHPLFASPTDPLLDPAGSFQELASYKGRLGKGRRFFEPVAISAVVGGDSIAGFYSRTRVIAKGARVLRRCETGSLPFTAERYVPAVEAPTGQSLGIR